MAAHSSAARRIRGHRLDGCHLFADVKPLYILFLPRLRGHSPL